MLDPDSSVDADWQVRAIEYMCRALLWFEDADEHIQEWLNEATSGDEAALVYAMKSWEVIRCLSQDEIQRLELQCRAWRRARARLR